VSDDPNTGERGASPVGEQRKPLLSKRALVWAVVGITAGVLVLIFYRSSNTPPEKIKEKLPARLASLESYVPPMIVPQAPRPPPELRAATPPPAPAPEPPRAPPPLPEPRASPLASLVPSMPKAQSFHPNMLSYPDPSGAQAGSNAPGGEHGTAPDGTPAKTVTYASTKLSGVKAGLVGDQTFLLMPGLTSCVLDTAIDSQLSGPIQCHIDSDIRPHGVTLIDRGSIIQGTYKGDVRNGQSRIAVAADWIWDKTTGCVVQLDNAPMADELGRAGLDGHVDNHIFERFGAAVILSMIDSGIQLGQAALSKGGNTYLSFSSGGDAGNLASQILRKQIDIPPTITKNQGDRIAVFITKPLDFSACYDVALRSRQ